MDRGQILQIVGAVCAGMSTYFLTQIVLYLMAHPKPSNTEESEKADNEPD